MLVPGLAEVSTTSVRAALQGLASYNLAHAAPLRSLQAVGALIEQLSRAGPAQAGFATSV